MKEADIEDSLLQKLQELKYTYRPDIRSREALEGNFRQKFQALNRVSLSDAEFMRLRDEIISADVFACAKRLREMHTFQREDGTPLQYTLLNITEWCKNEFEVIHQLRINTHSSYHRYDVLLLINGLPLVQIELKSLELSPRRAIQQIVDYKNDPGNGYTNTLLCFMQLFIVSNNTNTQYFANNNNAHFRFDAEEQFLPMYQFAAEDNKKITHLHDFADAFLGKCSLSQTISKYIVLVASEQKLLIMRPYQIYAVKAIVDCIHQNRGNGYIWHTTGSGKTLSSFKASTLLKDNPDIEKCLFVVDRKDLDRQTRQEFNKFQEGCVEENTNTESLVRRMLSDDYADKVIVCTIQKLGLALDPNPKNPYKQRLQALRSKRVVFIFDECHRSQFGDNHKAIKEFFPHAQLFGFTGTPIFQENAIYQQADGVQGSYIETKDVFQQQLHAYTITNAIDDKNVLRFHIDYFKAEQQLPVGSSKHKAAVVEAILAKHNAATHTRRFNAILATASISDAIEYYNLFKSMQQERQAYAQQEGQPQQPEQDENRNEDQNQNYIPLNIACVFSPPAEGNNDVQQLQEDLQQEKEDNKHEPDKKKQALKTIIADYNKQYGTNHSIGEFDLYYQDLQQRIKFQKFSNADYPHHNKIDITIVVDMLLTGFDSPYLNTLYVDKNLRYHGLIQAFSRTNRILNATKPYGNILDFRQQQTQVDEAIALFSGKDTDKAKEIWLVDPVPVVVQKYENAVAAMAGFMRANNTMFEPQEVYNLRGDSARIDFINRFKEVQRLRTQLDQYTDLSTEQQEQIDIILPPNQLRSFRASYLELAQQLRAEQQQKKDSDSPPQPELEELDFEFVLFASALVDYDYIMALIAKYTHSKPNKRSLSREQLMQLLGSTANLMDEREELIAYIDSLEIGKGMSEEQIRQGYIAFKEQKFSNALASLARKQGIEPEALHGFVQHTLSRMIFNAEQLTDLLAPLDLGWKERRQRELALMAELLPLLKKAAAGRDISGLSAYE